MSWCDKLASTPTVGFRLDPHYAASESIISSLAPLFDVWGTPEKPEFTISRLEVFRVDVQRENGFFYSIEPAKASVAFMHRMRLRPSSGGLPVGELISKPLPFSQLLDDATEQLISLSPKLPGAEKRSISRIGIVSTTTVASDDLPPGIQRMIKYFGRPWSGSLKAYQINLTAVLSETDRWTDRCTHVINRPEDDEQLMTVRFDWQRLPTHPLPITEESLKKEMAICQRAAIAYFEEVAVGDRFDEHIIDIK